MTKKTEGLRVGPITLVTLIAALLLAVLAMLCATTANAQATMANRQATSLTETYAIDSCGQRMIAGIEESLNQGDVAAALTTAKLDAIANNAKTADGASDLNIESEYDGSTVSFTISAPSGKTLRAKVTRENASVSVEEWKLTTTQEMPQDELWSSDNTK